MSRQALGGVVVALSIAAAIGFTAIAVHEFSYASEHPHAYGPAKVITWGAVTGAVLAIAVAVVGYVLARASSTDRELPEAGATRGSTNPIQPQPPATSGPES